MLSQHLVHRGPQLRWACSKFDGVIQGVGLLLKGVNGGRRLRGRRSCSFVGAREEACQILAGWQLAGT